MKLHGKWLYPDGILIVEAQALLKSLTRIANTVWGQNIRQLLLVDNMATALAFDRSRSRNFKVLRVIRKFAASCLARNITCSVRWIPSEYLWPQMSHPGTSQPQARRTRTLATPAAADPKPAKKTTPVLKPNRASPVHGRTAKQATQRLAPVGLGELLVSKALEQTRLRHSGPSIDRARNWRSLHEVQKRGSWKAHKSVLRYEKAARLSLSYQSLPQSLRDYVDTCELQVGDVLLNRRPPPAGP